MYIYQIERVLLQREIKKFAHYMTGAVLDVGAGELNRYGHLFPCTSFTRLDISEGADITASADDIPLSDESFDSICSTQMLEHVRFPEKCVQEMYRVLKKEGHALITAPQSYELHEEPHDYWRYTCYGLQDLFERNGFVTIEKEQRGGFFSTVAQMTTRLIIAKFSLHERPVAGQIARRFFAILGRLAIWLDARGGEANRKHALGWVFVLRKPS